MSSTSVDTSGDSVRLFEALGTLWCHRLALRCRNARLSQENQALRKQNAYLARFVRMAHCDPLTDLRNRRYFEERLSEEFERCARHPGRDISLVLIDVDGFKAINDRYGHPEGDQVLRAVADTLRFEVRQIDVCCRFGGDEFVVLLPDVDAERCRRFVERFPKTIFTPACGAVGLSIGWATRESGEAPSDLLSRADRAMYRAKNASTGFRTGETDGSTDPDRIEP